MKNLVLIVMHVILQHFELHLLYERSYTNSITIIIIRVKNYEIRKFLNKKRIKLIK